MASSHAEINTHWRKDTQGEAVSQPEARTFHETMLLSLFFLYLHIKDSAKYKVNER